MLVGHLYETYITSFMYQIPPSEMVDRGRSNGCRPSNCDRGRSVTTEFSMVQLDPCSNTTKNVSYHVVSLVTKFFDYGQSITKWYIQWIRSCIQSPTISILVSGSPTIEFTIQRSLIQGGPIIVEGLILKINLHKSKLARLNVVENILGKHALLLNCQVIKKLLEVAMSLFSKSIVLLFVVMLVSVSNVFGKTHVLITNNLEQHQDLNIHCKSRDDDLGMKFLRFNETYEFSFGNSYIVDTQFYCSFQWKNGPLVYYDVYIQDRDDSLCRLCHWYVKKDGPCRFEDDHLTCYKWNDTSNGLGVVFNHQ
ncbi:S-protein-like 29, partial [Mucuna pruriens]